MAAACVSLYVQFAGGNTPARCGDNYMKPRQDTVKLPEENNKVVTKSPDYVQVRHAPTTPLITCRRCCSFASAGITFRQPSYVW